MDIDRPIADLHRAYCDAVDVESVNSVVAGTTTAPSIIAARPIGSALGLQR